MKLLWLCNQVPGPVREHFSGKSGSALWVDSVFSDIRKRDITLRVLCRGGDASGELDARCSYALFPEILPEKYAPWMDDRFYKELMEFQPDLIHIWGTEYGHTLSMVNAAEKAGMLDRTVISIQGLCSMITRHFCEGIPERVLHGYTFRDFVKRNNLLGQQRVFALRGEHEQQALGKVNHVIGRTPWDMAATGLINPGRTYHFCNETLRPEFYQGQWRYEDCRSHRIFASGCNYPVKGFHYLLEAFAQILQKYPDATLAVPGKNFCSPNFKAKLRESSYDRYLRNLVRKYHLEGKVEILGGLSAERMRQEYLQANVFVLPSTVENSPNSMGEAMLLGVPCVAADVGGVSAMLTHNKDGYVYQSTAPYMLAHYIDKVFSIGEAAQSLGKSAADHARATHNAGKNLEDLLGIYREIADVKEQ